MKSAGATVEVEPRPRARNLYGTGISRVAGTVRGRLADRWGRKRALLLLTLALAVLQPWAGIKTVLFYGKESAGGNSAMVATKFTAPIKEIACFWRSRTG